MSIKLDKFSLNAETSLIKAQKLASELSHVKIEREHFLYCLLKDNSPNNNVFASHKIDVMGVLSWCENKIAKIEKQTQSLKEPFVSKALQIMLSNAEVLSIKKSENQITVDHCLEILITIYASQLTKETKAITKIDDKVLLNKDKNNQLTESQQLLDIYCSDLVVLAEKNALDPVIGREDEVRSLVQILSRRLKNNPLLIGEPGVGKTAIVEGLAQRIFKKDVPDSLKDKRLLSLDIGALIAGASFRGEFEKRIRELIKAIKSQNGKIILFIDEMHMLMGAGSSDGSIDAINLLKPSLARGELHCIGATTLSEYKKYIEKDQALVRRFHQIMVLEPSVEATLTMLRGLKSKYELHHKVKISDNALLSAVELSKRYITERFLPDKAIDLIDESASSLRIKIDSLPDEVNHIDGKILNLKLEIGAHKNDRGSGFNTYENEETIRQLESEKKNIISRWNKEREEMNSLHELKKKIDHNKFLESQAQQQEDFDKAAFIHYEVLVGLIDEFNILSFKREKNVNITKETVEPEDIALVVASKTKIDVSQMLKGEKEKLLNMEKELSKVIVGQSDAINALSKAIRRSRAGVSDPKRPIGSFIFCGSTGVGKTQLAHKLAQFIFGAEDALLVFDMSEYMESNSHTRLIGAPPGYVGFEEGGLLTEAIRQKPYTVLLFDEIEKAHTNVFNLFLQLLDEGKLTDSTGRQINFKNTLIIMTTNLGAEEINNAERLRDDTDLNFEAKKSLLIHFKPEFINRLDEVIAFRSLSLSSLKKICVLETILISERLQKQGITITISDEAQTFLAKTGYDPAFGARSLTRTIQSEVLDTISLKLLDGSLKQNDQLSIDAEEHAIKFTVISND